MTKNNLRNKIYIKPWTGLGIVLVVFAVIGGIVAPSYLSRIPRDFSYKATVFSHDNLYDLKSGQYSGKQNSNTEFYFKTTSYTESKVDIENVFNVKTPDGEEIVNISRSYSIDRTTGKHLASKDIQREGYLFAPQDIKPGQSYTYWHVNYNQPLTMQFIAEENILGLRVFKYTATFEADQTRELEALPDVPEKKGIKLAVTLSTWIEPTTGHLIKYEDSADAFYYDRTTGKQLEPWNQFSNKYASSSIAEQVEHAQRTLAKRTLLGITGPIILGIIGACILLGSIIGTSLLQKYLYIIVLFGSLGISLLVFRAAIANDTYAVQKDYGVRTDNLSDAIVDNLDTYQTSLEGGRALFNASDEVTRNDWKEYVRSLNIGSQLAGLQGIGFAKRLQSDNEISKLESYIRRQGDSNFSVRSDSKKPDYYPVTYLGPDNERNGRAAGYDMYSEPVRRKAMDEAIQNGKTSLSGVVTLTQENGVDNQPGYILYLPVYKKGALSYNQIQRQASITGFVFEPIRSNDFVQAIISQSGENLSFDIVDITNQNPSVVYETKSPHNDYVFKEKHLQLFGRTWLIRFYTNPQTLATGNPISKWSTLIVGLVVSSLLTTTTYFFQKTNSRAQAIASRMTRQLREQTLAAESAAQMSDTASNELALSQARLLRQNNELKETKRAVTNILQDLAMEKDNLTNEKLRSEAIFESIGDGVIVINEYGAITRMNQAAQKLLGLQEKDIGRGYIDVVSLYDVKDQLVSVEKRPVMQAIVSGKTSYTREYSIQGKSRTKFPVALTVSPFLIDGKPVGVVEVFRDISKEKQLESAKDEFLSLASHQLRTPATAVKQFLGIVREGYVGKVTAEQKDIVDSAYESNERQLRVVDDMLNVSRLNLGRLVVTPELIDIDQLLKDIVVVMKPRYEQRKQKLTYKGIKGHSTIADRNLLRQVLENIIDNASKYTPDGGKVNIELTQPKDLTNIAITDTGVGIDKKAQKNLFQKFSRVQNNLSVTRGGSGLGLYVAKQMIKLQKGDITVKSKPGVGTTFTVELKYRKENDDKNTNS